MLHSNTKPLFVMIVMLFTITITAKGMSDNNWDGYLISAAQNTPSELLAEYVFQQLSKRAKNPTLIRLEQNNHLKKTFDKHKVIYVDVSNNLGQEYCVKRTQNILKLHLNQVVKNNQ